MVEQKTTLYVINKTAFLQNKISYGKTIYTAHYKICNI